MWWCAGIYRIVKLTKICFSPLTKKLAFPLLFAKIIGSAAFSFDTLNALKFEAINNSTPPLKQMMTYCLLPSLRLLVSSLFYACKIYEQFLGQYKRSTKKNCRRCALRRPSWFDPDFAPYLTVHGIKTLVFALNGFQWVNWNLRILPSITKLLIW